MARSDPDLPAGIAARALREGDLAAAMALSQEAGWNQTAGDWRIFLELGSGIGLFREAVGLVATAATLPHAGHFAWISMVLVTAAEQRRGLARWLLRHCIGQLLESRLVPVLDATPAGRAVYAGLGFEDGWSLKRLIARRIASPVPAAEHGDTIVRSLAESDWPRLVAYDGAVFGADRGALLRRLAERLPHAAWVAERRGRLAGYVLGRDGRVMNQLGPVVAEDPEVARALLAPALAAVPAPVALDIPDRQQSLGDHLAALGFTAERPLTRMIYGGGPSPGDDARYFAIAGPELG